MTLASNDFELFGVPLRFAQDRSTLDARWKALQREAHPDKFAAQGPKTQRLAMQWSVRINEAYQRLKDPLRRAAYLCELAGVRVNAQDNTAMPPEFLLQQMQWREALDAASSAPEVNALLVQVQESRREALHNCEQMLDVQAEPAKAAGQVRALMFIERFCSDIEARQEQYQVAASTPMASGSAAMIDHQ